MRKVQCTGAKEERRICSDALYENHTKGCDETPKRQGLSARRPL